jgi:hypothetical protein
MNPKKLLRKYNKKNKEIECGYAREWIRHVNQLSKGARVIYKKDRIEDNISIEAVNWLVGLEMEVNNENN